MKNIKKTGLLVKIVTPILIVAIIGAIWIFKNSAKESAQTPTSPTPSSTSTPSAQNNSSSTADKGNSSNGEVSNTDKNADFALAATEIDLEKLKSYGLPIIIDFGADSCIPCKEMAPVLKKLNAELQGKVIVKFVDVWKYKDAAANFPVEVIPTQFFFDKNGKPYVPSDPDKMQMKMYSTKNTNEHIYTSHQGGLTEEQIREVLKEMGVK